MEETYTEEYKLPAYWASYLINDDPTSLEDGEMETINKWIEDNIGCDFIVNISNDESYFSHTNDATNLGGDVYDYQFTMW